MKWTRPLLAVERWFFDEAPLEPLAACRVVLGFAFVWFYVGMAPSHDLLWGTEGLVRYAFDPEAPSWLQVHAGWLKLGTLLGGVCLMLGLLTRPMAVLLVACHMGHTSQTQHFTWGWGMVAPALVIYLVLSCSHHVWSLDAWLRRRRRPDEPYARTASAWPMRLVQVNAVAIYLAAAWHRIDDPAWLRGEMVFEAIATGVFTRAPGLDVVLYPYKGWLEVLCWYTWIVELAAPLFLCIRRTAPWMAVLLYTVHFGLELGAFVGSWQLMMFAALATFLKPAWLRSIVGWPGRLFGRGRHPTGDPEPA